MPWEVTNELDASASSSYILGPYKLLHFLCILRYTTYNRILHLQFITTELAEGIRLNWQFLSIGLAAAHFLWSGLLYHVYNLLGCTYFRLVRDRPYEVRHENSLSERGKGDGEGIRGASKKQVVNTGGK